MPKRSDQSSTVLQVVGLVEFLSARHFPFTVAELADDMELSDTSARRFLRTVETAGWVEKTEFKRPTDATGGGAGQHYRAAVRIRRVANGG